MGMKKQYVTRIDASAQESADHGGQWRTSGNSAGIKAGGSSESGKCRICRYCSGIKWLNKGCCMCSSPLFYIYIKLLKRILFRFCDIICHLSIFRGSMFQRLFFSSIFALWTEMAVHHSADFLSYRKTCGKLLVVPGADLGFQLTDGFLIVQNLCFQAGIFYHFSSLISGSFASSFTFSKNSMILTLSDIKTSDLCLKIIMIIVPFTKRKEK